MPRCFASPPRRGQPSNRPIGDAWRTFFCPPTTKRFDSFQATARRELLSGSGVNVARAERCLLSGRTLALGHVLDQVIKSLPAAMRTPYNRTEIARNMLACAATGERDPIELELAATIDLKVSTAA